MTCQQVQMKLSLYLYGELDFSQEEDFEHHLSECALCQRALAREKSWHTALNAERTDVPLALLAECRSELRTRMSSVAKKPGTSWFHWLESLGFSGTRWSLRIAVASFLVLAGFSAGRWMDRNGLARWTTGESTEMSLIDPSQTRVRDIQMGQNDRVRILFDQVRPREIIGRVEDADVRQLLLAAMKDPTDPGIRVDSLEMLKDDDSSDVRDALLYSVQHDTNAAVRLRALEGLQRFAGDQTTRNTLKFVLEHDDNPAVRAEAIDALAPANQLVEFSPDLAGTLEQIARSERENDYVRLRSIQLLREMRASLDIY